MLVASIPAKFSIPWANSAGGSYINAIPTASQIGIIAGAASLTDGFPPTTMQTGGTPPAGPDFNGILKWVTQWAQWQAAGGPVAYDSTFQTAIGGYPKGAIVSSSAIFGEWWLNLVDANTTNPDTGGANWVGFSLAGGGNSAQYATAGTFSWTCPSWVTKVKATVTGAGGGGAGGTSSCGGGNGGAGGTAISWVTVSPGTVYTVIVGGAGAAGAAGIFGGNTGGTSSALGLSATGGAGGANTGATGAGGAGGVGSGGTINLYGGYGGDGSGASLVQGYGGSGGASYWGGGGRGSAASGQSGLPGQAPGSGGGGSYGPYTNAGGNGAPGIVVLEY